MPHHTRDERPSALAPDSRDDVAAPTPDDRDVWGGHTSEGLYEHGPLRAVDPLRRLIAGALLAAEIAPRVACDKVERRRKARAESKRIRVLQQAARGVRVTERRPRAA